jgi:RHS repeat-associated protein
VSRLLNRVWIIKHSPLIIKNHLNLPTQFSFTPNTNKIDILYDYTGKKLRKTVTTAGVVTYIQDYVGNLEWRKQGTNPRRLEALYHDEGRIVPAYSNATATTPSSYAYEYSMRDHLGNTRLTFADANADGIVQVPEEINQENHYYPFGMSMGYSWLNNASQDSKYQYNGKELSEEFGLNLMDYGARWYDAGTARWWTVDVLASDPNQVDLTPYQYAWNNPVKLIDPDGNCPWCPYAVGFVTGALTEIGTQVATNLMAGKPAGNIDWADVGVAGTVGGATQGANLVGATVTGIKVVAEIVKAGVDIDNKGNIKVVGGKGDYNKDLETATIDLTGAALGESGGAVLTKAGKAAMGTSKMVKAAESQIKAGERQVSRSTPKGKGNSKGKSKIESGTKKLKEATTNANVLKEVSTAATSTAGGAAAEKKKDKKGL